MRLFHTLAALSVAVGSMAQTDTIAYVNTMEITPGTSRSELAARAAHLVPTPAQLAALDDGYIAFRDVL